MLKKNKKMAQKLKTMELVHVYFVFKNKSTIINNFLAFSVFFPQNLPPWIRIRIPVLNADPDPEGNMNEDTDPQPSPARHRIIFKQ